MPVTFTSKIEAAGMGAVGIVITEPRPGRIPFSAIDRYAQRYGIVGSAFDCMLDLVGRIDEEFLAWEVERAQARAAARG